jgi:RNA polymerase sigma-70 factor (ECF subfamily)
MLTSTRAVAEPSGADRSTGSVDERLWVWPHLKALPAKQRAVLVLRYYEDLTEAQTALALGCSVGTVKSHHSRALRTLRQRVSNPTRGTPPSSTEKGMPR